MIGMAAAVRPALRRKERREVPLQVDEGLDSLELDI